MILYVADIARIDDIQARFPGKKVSPLPTPRGWSSAVRQGIDGHAQIPVPKLAKIAYKLPIQPRS